MKQLPRIVKSPLSNDWYVVTRYRERRGVDAETGEPHAYLVASEKFKVTDQMRAILKAMKGKRR